MLRPNQNSTSTNIGCFSTHQLRNTAPLEGASSFMVSSQIIGALPYLSYCLYVCAVTIFGHFVSKHKG